MNKPFGSQLLFVTPVFALAAVLIACRNLPAPIDADLEPLQGHWEGDGAGGRCHIDVTGNTLRYRAGTNWWKTTFILPAGTEPRQLHARIEGSSPPTNGIGTVVFAIFKIENDTLTLAEIDGADQPPESFDAAASRYTLRRFRPR